MGAVKGKVVGGGSGGIEGEHARGKERGGSEGDRARGEESVGSERDRVSGRENGGRETTQPPEHDTPSQKSYVETGRN